MTTGVKLDEQTKARLQNLGNQLDRSPHWIMKTAIEEYLTKQERYWQERHDDQARWEHYQLTQEGVSFEEMDKWLGKLADGEEAQCPD